MNARRLATAAAATAAVTAAAALAACGSNSTEDRPDRPASLILDFTPNAVHAGIYLALDREFDGAEGVELEVETPSSATDSIKLLLGGRAQMAILDIHDLAVARAKGRDVVGVMALVQRPLAAVLAQPGVRTPRALEGRRVGVTGLPSDDAVLRSIVEGAGGDAGKVRKVTIGFQAVPALLGRRVEGATAFWNAEGIAVRSKRPGIREFRVDDYGAPPYPELVLATSRETLRDDRAIVRATVRALRRGYREALLDPESAVTALVDANRGLDRAGVMRALQAVEPALTAAPGGFGALDRKRLDAWARWEQRFGIVERRPDVERAFDFSLVDG